MFGVWEEGELLRNRDKMQVQAERTLRCQGAGSTIQHFQLCYIFDFLCYIEKM